MRQFTVELNNAYTFPQVVESFNTGLIHPCGGKWNGKSWDAFHDYLSWPEEDQYVLMLLGWHNCKGITSSDRDMFASIFKNNPHVCVEFA